MSSQNFLFKFILLNPLDPKNRQIIQRKYRSQMADQICYAVLCVFSYLAAGLEERRKNQQASATSHHSTSQTTSGQPPPPPPWPSPGNPSEAHRSQQHKSNTPVLSKR